MNNENTFSELDISTSQYILNLKEKMKINNKEVAYFTVPKGWYSHQEFGPDDHHCIVINRVGVYDTEDRFIKWIGLREAVQYLKDYPVKFL